MRKLIRSLGAIVVAAQCMLYVGSAEAAAASSLSGVASNILGTFGALAKLITGGAFIAGFGFAVAAILKFKAHRDNPTQIPVGTPIALMFVAVAMLFLPALFGGIGATVFGSGATAGSISGVTSLSGL